MANLTGRGVFRKKTDTFERKDPPPLDKPEPKPKGIRKRSPKKASYMASQARQDGLAHNLRKNAMGQNCTLRLEGCRHDPAYTVLAHIRRFGWAGMGQKPHDVLAMFACDKCHEKQERRHADCTDTDILRAMGETIMVQIESGFLLLK